MQANEGTSFYTSPYFTNKIQYITIPYTFVFYVNSIKDLNQ